MEYKIVREIGPGELSNEVNRQLKLGYDLVGGLTCYTKVDDLSRTKECPRNTEVWFCQAMIKSTI